MISHFESLFTKQLNSVNQIGELQAKGKNTLVRDMREQPFWQTLYLQKKKEIQVLYLEKKEE